MPRHAFTLLETIIAVSLGMLIVLVATAGFRTASQTITRANQLSLQNGILRASVVAANEEMDFWDTLDNRIDATRQPLRGGGQPFQPLDFSTPTTVLDFNHVHPRMWWNGQIWSSNKNWDGQRRFGDYSIFGKQGTPTDGPIIFPPDITPTPAWPADRAWRHNIVKHISDNLGYYALIDYVPANFIIAYFASDGQIPDEFGMPGVGPGRFRPNWHSGDKPLSKVEVGHDHGFILTKATGVPGFPNTHPISHRSSYNSHRADFNDDQYCTKWEPFSEVDFPITLPVNWPTVKMQVRLNYRFIQFGHQVRIQHNDPMSGESTTLTLNALTTTLRGARRQRGLDQEPPPSTIYP
jgi:type II secretory pathway pseudopilin PulG